MRALGATACRAHPKVLKNIAKQLEQHHILSAQELQIARLMGIVTTNAIARPSFNNRIFFRYELSTPQSRSTAGSKNGCGFSRLEEAEKTERARHRTAGRLSRQQGNATG